MGGISSNTPSNIVFGDNGYLTVNSADMGATQGAFSVEWGAEKYYPDLAQAWGQVAATGRLSGGFFRLKATVTELTWTNLSLLLAELGADSSGSSYKIGGGVLSTPTELTTVCLVGVTRNDNKALRVTLPKCYVEIEPMSFERSKEVTMGVTFFGLYTATDYNKLPGYIEIQK